MSREWTVLRTPCRDVSLRCRATVVDWRDPGFYACRDANDALFGGRILTEELLNEETLRVANDHDARRSVRRHSSAGCERNER